MRCSNCGTENRAGAKFCRVCGNSLSLTCPNGHPVEAGSRFCDECGDEARDIFDRLEARPWVERTLKAEALRPSVAV